MVVAQQLKFPLLEALNATIVDHQFRQAFDGRSRPLGCVSLPVLQRLQSRFQSREFSTAAIVAPLNGLQRVNHCVHSLSYSLRPTPCRHVVESCKPTLHINTLASNVRDQLPTSFRVQMKQLGVSVVQVKASMARERNLQMIF